MPSSLDFHRNSREHDPGRLRRFLPDTRECRLEAARFWSTHGATPPPGARQWTGGRMTGDIGPLPTLWRDLHREGEDRHPGPADTPIQPEVAGSAYQTIREGRLPRENVASPLLGLWPELNAHPEGNSGRQSLDGRRRAT